MHAELLHTAFTSYFSQELYRDAIESHSIPHVGGLPVRTLLTAAVVSYSDDAESSPPMVYCRLGGIASPSQADAVAPIPLSGAPVTLDLTNATGPWFCSVAGGLLLSSLWLPEHGDIDTWKYNLSITQDVCTVGMVGAQCDMPMFVTAPTWRHAGVLLPAMDADIQGTAFVARIVLAWPAKNLSFSVTAAWDFWSTDATVACADVAAYVGALPPAARNSSSSTHFDMLLGAWRLCASGSGVASTWEVGLLAPALVLAPGDVFVSLVANGTAQWRLQNVSVVPPSFVAIAIGNVSASSKDASVAFDTAGGASYELYDGEAIRSISTRNTLLPFVRVPHQCQVASALVGDTCLSHANATMHAQPETTAHVGVPMLRNSNMSSMVFVLDLPTHAPGFTLTLTLDIDIVAASQTELTVMTSSMTVPDADSYAATMDAVVFALEDPSPGLSRRRQSTSDCTTAAFNARPWVLPVSMGVDQAREHGGWVSWELRRPRSGPLFVTVSAILADRPSNVSHAVPLPTRLPYSLVFHPTATLSACSAACAGNCVEVLDGALLRGVCECPQPQRFAGENCDVRTDSDAGYAMRLALLTGSNAAASASMALALYYGLVSEALVLALSGIASGVYHSCDTGGACPTSYAAMQAFDFCGSYLSIFVLSIRLAGMPPVARQPLTLLMIGVLMYCMLEPTSTKQTVTLAVAAVISIFTVLCSLLWSAWANVAAAGTIGNISLHADQPVQITLPHRVKEASRIMVNMIVFSGNFRGRLLVSGILVFLIAIVCKLLASNNNYWLMHSAWHVGSFGAAALLVLARCNYAEPLIALHCFENVVPQSISGVQERRSWIAQRITARYARAFDVFDGSMTVGACRPTQSSLGTCTQAAANESENADVGALGNTDTLRSKTGVRDSHPEVQRTTPAVHGQGVSGILHHSLASLSKFVTMPLVKMRSLVATAGVTETDGYAKFDVATND